MISQLRVLVLLLCLVICLSNAMLVDGWGSVLKNEHQLPRLASSSKSGTTTGSRFSTSLGLSRRPFMHNIVSVAGSCLFTSGLLDPPCTAAAATTTTTPGEAIRQSASNIPGYGPSDIFYPMKWKGTWRVERQVLIHDKIYNLNYTMRFLPSIKEDAVVADRGFNQANLENSFVTGSLNNNNSSSSSIVQSYSWTETNPNDLRISFTDGRRKDIKVTKRATEYKDNTVSSSEFQRIVEDTNNSNSMMVPIIAARRVVSKWKEIEADHLEAIEIVYDMSASIPSADPMAFSPQSASVPTSNVLSKSRLRLTRVQ